jgi:ubiquinone biosynthesis protein
MLEDNLLMLLSTGDLVPASHAHYRAVVADALGFFLQQLPAGRRAAILQEQASLPAATTSIDRLVALCRQCPTLHKLGQVLARHRPLAPECRFALARLETHAPTAAADAVQDAIERELRTAAGEGLVVGASPLAEASVAVVVPCAWHCGGAAPRQGVIKVLKPGIVARLEEDLAVWSQLGEFLEERTAHYGLPAIDYREIFAQVRDLLLAEVCFVREQENLAAAREAFASRPGVIVPEVWPFSTARLTVMDFLPGRKVTSVEHLAAEERRTLCTAVVEHLLAGPFITTSPMAMFHGDPHAGNVLHDDAGRLGLIDWALAGRLDRRGCESLVQLVIGGASADRSRMAAALAASAAQVASTAGVLDVVDRAMQRLLRGAVPGPRWLCAVMDDAAASGAVRFSEDFLLLRKVMAVVDGVAGDIWPDCDIDAVVIAHLFRSLAGEWPARAANPFSATPHGVPVATADLFAMAAEAPLAMGRWWMEWFRQR